MGLSPQYYDVCTDDVLNLYAEVEDRIIADVVRRIIKTGDITETAKWQIRQAQQMGLLYDDIIKDVAKSTDKTDSEVKKMFENAGVETVNNNNRIHIKAGKSPLDIRQSESMLQILNGVYKNSLTDLKNLTGTTAITSQTAYYQACNSAFMMVSSGAFSYQQALRTVIQEVADKGATVSYPSGHIDKLDVAVRRSLLTGIGLASRQISEENSRLCECDLMEISAHSGARPSHAVWQGQIVSLSGRRGYLSKSDIGYGTGAGFGGWNCRHDWYPFYEGISTRNYSQSELDKLNAKDIKYNGKMYSEYEISQMLRQKEREIRALKREQVALKTAISEGQDFLKTDLTALNSKIKDKSLQIQEFCNQTGYKRDRFREQVQGFNRSVTSKSTWANKKSRNDLTSDNGSGNINIGNTAGKTAIKNADDIDKNLLKYDFKPIGKAHSIEDDMKAVNPNYFTGKPEFTQNCQRCVCAYEIRRRGFNVEALPKILDERDKLAYMNKKDGWTSVFNDYAIPCIGGNELAVANNIKSTMKEWGNGSRAIVRIVYDEDNGGTGHVFIAEQVDGNTIFLDPQSNQYKYDDVFFCVDLDKTCIMRIDDKEITDLITRCCKNKEN